MQTWYNKQLVPLAKTKTYFTSELEDKISDFLEDTFIVNWCRSIENPVRRSLENILSIMKAIKKSFASPDLLKMHLTPHEFTLRSACQVFRSKKYSSLF